jgi:hypothetical protein
VIWSLQKGFKSTKSSASGTLIGCLQTFIVATEAAQITAPFKVPTGLRTQVIVPAPQSCRVKPDAGQQVKVFISPDAFPDRFQQGVGNVPERFFARLKGWNGCSTAACCTLITGFNQW